MAGQGFWTPKVFTGGTIYVNRAAVLYGLILTPGAGTGTLTLYDSTGSASGTVLIISGPANQSIPVMFGQPVSFGTAINGLFTGTVANVTIFIG